MSKCHIVGNHMSQLVSLINYTDFCFDRRSINIDLRSNSIGHRGQLFDTVGAIY